MVGFVVYREWSGPFFLPSTPSEDARAPLGPRPKHRAPTPVSGRGNAPEARILRDRKGAETQEAGHWKGAGSRRLGTGVLQHDPLALVGITH